MTSDSRSVFSCSKDGALIKWDLESGSKTYIKKSRSKDASRQLSGYLSELLCVALSSDDRYVASGGRDNCVRVFDARSKFAEINSFTGHRGAVTSLAFRNQSYSLFSGSQDRCIKHWNLSEMGYVETLFGHQVFLIPYTLQTIYSDCCKMP